MASNVTSDKSPDLAPDCKVNGYDVYLLNEKIGSGGYGIIYKALLKSNGKELLAAAKNVPADSTTEIELLSKLKHTNIVEYFGTLKTVGMTTIFTAFAEKGDLYDILHTTRTSKDVPTELAWTWIQQAADGIQFMHERGVVHYDIKPRNMLITAGNTLKITDFGVARSADLSTDGRAGTVRWMAPEVIRGIRRRSKKPDVYSFGIVTWEILTKRIPFAALKSDFRISEAVKNGERPQIDEQCPVWLREIIGGCWCEDDRKRLSIDDVIKKFPSEVVGEDMAAMKKLCTNDDVTTGCTGDPENAGGKGEQPVLTLCDVLTNGIIEAMKETFAVFNQCHESMREIDSDLGKKQTIENKLQRIKAERDKLDKLKEIWSKTPKLPTDVLEQLSETVRNAFQSAAVIQASFEGNIAEEEEKLEDIEISLQNPEEDNDPKGTIIGLDYEKEMIGEQERREVKHMDEVVSKHVTRKLLPSMAQERFTHSTIQSFSRLDALQKTLPRTSQSTTAADGEALTSLSAKQVTDVFQLEEIPSPSTLDKWRSDIAETLRNLPDGVFVYIESDSHTFDMEALCHMSLLHTARKMKEDAQTLRTWAMSVDYPPVDLQKELTAQDVSKIHDDLLNPRWNEILTDFDMDSGELLQIGAGGQLSGDHMRWFAAKLNATQTDVLCLDTSAAHREEKEGDKVTKPEDTNVPHAFILLLNVGYSDGKVFIGDEENPGNHFSFCYVEKSVCKVIYGDSLGWPPPDDLIDLVSTHSSELWGSSLQDATLVLCHDPSSLSPTGAHICSNKCAPHFPLQKDGNICGVVVLLMSAIACLRPTFFYYLTSTQDDNNYRGTSHLRDPTSSGQYLRKVLAWWFITKEIDVDYTIPVNFDLYIFTRYKWKTCGPDVHDLHDLPQDPNTYWSLVDVMIQGPGSREQKLAKLNDQLLMKRKDIGHYVDEGDLPLTEERLKSLTRIETLNVQLPDVVANADVSINICDDPLPVTDVLELTTIADNTTVLDWKDELAQAKVEVGKFKHVYMENDDTRYDERALDKLLQVHNLMDIKRDVLQDISWFSTAKGTGTQFSDVPPSIEPFNYFMAYTFNTNVPDKRDETYGMNGSDLTRMFCNRWITAAHIRWILSHLNAMQWDTVCIYHSDVKDVKAFAEEHWRNVLRIPSSMVLVFEVSRSEEDDAVLREITELGNHVMLCHVNVASQQITVGDSLGWTAPVNLRETIAEYCREVLKTDSSTFQWVTAHPSSSMSEEHTCTCSCASYYPCQDCGSIAGVIVAVVAVLACLQPDVFRFLTTIKKTNRYPEADFLRKPTQSAAYLRRVLATWFAEEAICADHVVPRGFDESWLRGPTEDLSDLFMEYISIPVSVD